MKKHVFNRMILMLVIVATLCSMTGSAFAAGTNDLAVSAEMVSPRYAGIRELSADLTISSSGKAFCQVNAELYSAYTGKITMRLVNQSSGGQTVKSWSSDGAVCSGNYYVSKGNTYQVTLIHNVLSNQLLKNMLPNTLQAPPAKPGVHTFPRTIPIRQGKSRQGIPVFSQYRIPLSMTRLSFSGLPPCAGFSGGS